MRNLKKVLSLVLCMAMMLSIMVVGAGAAFKDQEKIVNDEAVDMCSALNIINGYTDGSYKPEGTITRAEACKMICIALNGGKEPVLGTNATATFTDIKGHWAEKYIEYCVSEGIVAGIGGGKFNPNGNVTGSQFAKMLLIALGFNAEHAKFLGAAWEVNVNVKATQKGLYEDLETMDPAVALTRDNAAQMVWNALQAYTVEYDYTLVSDNGTLSSQVVVKDTNKTLLYANYKGIVTETTLDSVSWNPDKEEWTYGLATDLVASDENDDDDMSVVSDEDYCELYKQAVKVVYTVKNGSVDEFLGMIPNSEIVTEGVIGDIGTVDTTNKEVEIDDVDYKYNRTETVNVYPFLTATNTNPVATLTNMSAVADAYSFQAIDNNDDGRIDVIVYYPVTVAEVSYVNAKGITANAVTYKFEDHNIADGIEKNDWVVITEAGNTANEEAVIVKADTITGKVTSVKDDGSVRVGNVWYDKANTDATPDIGDDVELIVYNGYYFHAEETSNALDIAVVKAVGNYDSMEEVRAVKLLIGNDEQIVNVETFKYNKVVESAKNYGAVNFVNRMVRYDIDDGVYTLTLVNQNIDLSDASEDYTTSVGATSYNEKNAAISIGGTYYDINSDAVVYLYNTVDDKYTVLTGDQLMAKNNITFSTSYTILDDGDVAYILAYVGGTVTSGDELYAFITDIGTAWNEEDEKEVVVIDAVTATGKVEEVETDIDVDDIGNYQAGTVISYAMDGDVLSVVDTITMSDPVAIKDANATRVLFRDGSRALLDKDSVIITIDSEDKDIDEVEFVGNDLIEAGVKDATSYYNNAIYATDADGITVIIVDAYTAGYSVLSPAPVAE